MRKLDNIIRKTKDYVDPYPQCNEEFSSQRFKKEERQKQKLTNLVKILVPVSLFSCQLRPEVQSCLLALHYLCLIIIILSFLCLIIITFSLPNKHFSVHV